MLCSALTRTLPLKTPITSYTPVLLRWRSWAFGGGDVYDISYVGVLWQRKGFGSVSELQFSCSRGHPHPLRIWAWVCFSSRTVSSVLVLFLMVNYVVLGAMGSQWYLSLSFGYF